jgi:hypothetical protein
VSDGKRAGPNPFGGCADTPFVGEGTDRLLWLLLFLGSWGEGDMSKLPSPILFAPPLDEELTIESLEPVSSLWSGEGWTRYAPCRPDPPIARVVWRDGIEEHMRMFSEMSDADGEAMRLRALGVEDVSIERPDDDDGLLSVTVKV